MCRYWLAKGVFSLGGYAACRKSHVGLLSVSACLLTKKHQCCGSSPLSVPLGSRIVFEFSQRTRRFHLVIFSIERHVSVGGGRCGVLRASSQVQVHQREAQRLRAVAGGDLAR